ncbi:MAG: peptidase [Planctomycetota bacterium]
MTFCLGMRVEDGLVGIADTRVTSGDECITAQKYTIYQDGDWSMFIMTSGLRSVRDKAITYFDELYEDADQPREGRLFKMVNLFADQIRRVAKEDREWLADSGLNFNIHALVGGQLPDDKMHHLYLIYPEGNWVEIGKGTPYHIIGQSGYGKPVLDRTLQYGDSIRFATKVGTLAFDSTRISAADVDFPLDLVIYVKDSFEIVTHRYEKEDLAALSNWWQDRLRDSIRNISMENLDPLLAQLPKPTRVIREETTTPLA